MTLEFGIVHAADPRYRGGTSSAVRAELVAAHRHGVATALLPYLGPRRIVQGMEPRLRAILAETGIPLLPWDVPASCDILLAHHPNVFEAMPDRPVALRPRHTVCVLHHPLFDGARRPQYDLERIETSLRLTYGAPVSFAPISPVIRAQIGVADLPPGRVVGHDLPNLIDLADWPVRDRPPPRSRAVIGRHSRSDPLKWPDTAAEVLSCYPASDTVEVRILGDAHLPKGLDTPADWTILPFREQRVSEFLRELDFWVYFHSARWIEAFGIAIAEALATGLVVILPPRFEPIFGEAAIYCHPAEVPKVLRHFMARPDEYGRQSRAARALIAERHGLDLYPERLARLYGDVGLPRSETGSGPLPHIASRQPQRILMLCGNGIGLGHITRLAAVARRLPDWIEPVFLTLSLGTALLRRMGFSADYVPSHGRLGVTERSWNDVFALELLNALDATGARMAVFDGNDAFLSIRQVMQARRDLSWVWIRRGLFQPHHRLNLETDALFDMIVEPLDLAGAEDGGPTARRPRVERVGPILLHRPEDRLDRDEACRRLGLDASRTNVAIQLGSQRNFDLSAVRATLRRETAGQDIFVFEFRNPLADPPNPEPDPLPLREAYPLYPLSRAIDLMICGAGYNSVHENVLGGINSIFVPNEATEMDDQLLRARVVEAAGLGISVTLRDLPRLGSAMRKALDPAHRALVHARSAALSHEDGAAQTAVLIGEILTSVRTDLPLARALPRALPL